MSPLIVVDVNACLFGWGPCEQGWGHECKKPLGHDGYHCCRLCGSRKSVPIGEGAETGGDQ